MGQDVLKYSSRISRHFCLEVQCDYGFIYRNAEARNTGSQRRVFFCIFISVTDYFFAVFTPVTEAQQVLHKINLFFKKNTCSQRGF